MIFKVTFVVMFTFMVTSVMAQQKGEMAVGGQIAYGSGDDYSNLGLGAKFQWNILDNIRLEPSFTYFLKKDYVNMWDLSADVHYLFPITDKVTVYPLAGLSILGVKASVPSVDLGEWGSYGEGSASDSEFGFNLGGGIDYKLADKLTLNAGLKYKMCSNWDRFIVSVGLAYKF